MLDGFNQLTDKYTFPPANALSGNKELHMRVQKGGMTDYMTSMSEVEYRNKYLKYKSKYLALKNN